MKVVTIPALESILHLLMVFINSVSRICNWMVIRATFTWWEMAECILNFTQTTRAMTSWVRQFLCNSRKVRTCGFVCTKVLPRLFMAWADTQHLLDIWSLIKEFCSHGTPSSFMIHKVKCSKYYCIIMIKMSKYS